MMRGSTHRDSLSLEKNGRIENWTIHSTHFGHSPPRPLLWSTGWFIYIGIHRLRPPDAVLLRFGSFVGQAAPDERPSSSPVSFSDFSPIIFLRTYFTLALLMREVMLYHRSLRIKLTAFSSLDRNEKQEPPSLQPLSSQERRRKTDHQPTHTHTTLQWR